VVASHHIKWFEDAGCLEDDPNLFFELYEDNSSGIARKAVDYRCMNCPVQKDCFYTGVSRNEWGVWGGVYLVDGEIDELNNNHKTPEDWADLWLRLTME